MLRLLFDVVGLGLVGLGISARRWGGGIAVLRSSARSAGVPWYIQTGIWRGSVEWK